MTEHRQYTAVASHDTLQCLVYTAVATHDTTHLMSLSISGPIWGPSWVGCVGCGPSGPTGEGGVRPRACGDSGDDSGGDSDDSGDDSDSDSDSGGDSDDSGDDSDDDSDSDSDSGDESGIDLQRSVVDLYTPCCMVSHNVVEALLFRFRHAIVYELLCFLCRFMCPCLCLCLPLIMRCVLRVRRPSRISMMTRR